MSATDYGEQNGGLSVSEHEMAYTDIELLTELLAAAPKVRRRGEGVTIGEFASAIGLSRSASSRFLHGEVRAGRLIAEERIDPASGRKVLVFLRPHKA